MTITIALINPEIPPNTGTIARLCGATGASLHIVGQANFDLSDKSLKRAGLDYWHLVDVTEYPDINRYVSSCDQASTFVVTTKSTVYYTAITYPQSPTLIFGNESSGLPQWIHDYFDRTRITIPMKNSEKGMRSLNLANSVSIVLYEIIRQQAIF
jgi:tRNA (cytidine/uridine-2'-O-)-methyltransferase